MLKHNFIILEFIIALFGPNTVLISLFDMLLFVPFFLLFDPWSSFLEKEASHGFHCEF